MSRQTTSPLDASLLLDGERCEKKQFMEMHTPDFAEPMDEAQELLAEEGLHVERLARLLFPGGLEVVGRDHADGTLGRTRLLRRRKTPPPAIFRAAFKYQGTTVRPKIMIREDDGSWSVAEVSASTEAKEADLLRLAVVVDTMKKARVPVRNIYLIHPNPEYTLPWHRELDPTAYFQVEDVTELIETTFLERVPEMRSRAKAMLTTAFAPDQEMGSHCNTPHPCPFKSHCKKFLVPEPISELNDLRQNLRETLKARGIASIREIPSAWAIIGGVPIEDLTEEELEQRIAAEVQAAAVEQRAPDYSTIVKKNEIAVKLSPAKCNQIMAVKSGETVVRRAPLKAWLDTLPKKLGYMDFEAYSSAVPKEAGHRPYQVIPFQFSVHQQMESGLVYPNSFLHAEGGDPRVRFAEELMRILPDEGAYLVWSPYEKSRLQDLARHFYTMLIDLDHLLNLGFTTAREITEYARTNPALDQSLVAKVSRLYGIALVREQTLTKGPDHLDEILGELDPDLADIATRARRDLFDLVHDEEADAVLKQWEPVLGMRHFFEDIRGGMSNDDAFLLLLSHWHAEWLRLTHLLQRAGGRALTEEQWPSDLRQLQAIVGGVLRPRRHKEAFSRLNQETGDVFRNPAKWEESTAGYGKEGRLVDMLPISRDLVYHPEQKGSHSIKAVVKTQVKGFGYEGLKIQNGAAAQMYFMKLLNGQIPADEVAQICMELTRYCERDTESEIYALRAWKAMVYGPVTPRVTAQPVRVRPVGARR